MAELPYMRFYPADFAAATMDLDATETGAYLMLLSSMWLAGGKLAVDHKRLARIARVESRDWERVWSAIQSFFNERDGFITNRRLTEEIEKASVDIREKRERMARARNAKRAGDINVDIKPDIYDKAIGVDIKPDPRSDPPSQSDPEPDPDPDRRLTPAVEDSLSLVPDEPEPAPKPKRQRKTELPPGFFNACLAEFCVGWSAVYGERYVPQPDELGLLRSFLGRLPEEHRDQWGQRLARYFADTTRYNVAERRHSLKAFVTGEAWNKYAVAVVAWKTPRQQEAENAAAQFLAGTDDLALEEPAPRKKLGGVL